jgi:hypothetical protein
MGGLFSENKNRHRWYVIPGGGGLPMVVMAGAYTESEVFSYIETHLLKGKTNVSYRVMRHIGSSYISDSPIKWEPNLFDVRRGENIMCYVSHAKTPNIFTVKRAEVIKPFVVFSHNDVDKSKGRDIGQIEVRLVETNEKTLEHVDMYGKDITNQQRLSIPIPAYKGEAYAG